MTRFVSMFILNVVICARVAASDIDLSQSKITPVTEKVPGGMMVTVNVVLKNTGDKPSDGTDLTINFPQGGFLIWDDALPGLKRDDVAREFTARVDIAAGEEYRFAFDLLASRNEVGNHLSTHIEARNLLADDLVAARWNSDVSIKIKSIPTKEGIVIGGLTFNPPPIGVALWLICAVVMFVWLRSRGIPALALVALVMIPVAFMMIAGGMAWRDLRTMTSWPESQATILGRREVVQSSTDNRTASEKNRGIGKRNTASRKPEFALKYQVGELEVISSGFDTGSSINLGGQILGLAAMDDWVAGKTIPCWYDPADPSIVVVRRGFGGAILLYGLFPLLFLWFGLRQLRKVSRAIKQQDEPESAVS
jgi:Protein of unknown function (DUF3592)